MTFREVAGVWMLSGLALNCTAASSAVGLSEAERSRIAAEVESGVWAFHAADTSLSAEGVIALLWPDFTMFADGDRLEYADVVEGSRSFMAGLELFDTDWTDLTVTPLSMNTAVSAFRFRDSIVTHDGELIQAQGPTTFVWHRRGGEWRIVHADADHYPVNR